MSTRKDMWDAMVQSHTHWLGWDGTSCVARCEVMLFMYMNNVYMYKMAEDENDNVLMLSAIYCRCMHNNLYWPLIGCCLLVLVRW